jgi:hypothetical protein
MGQQMMKAICLFVLFSWVLVPAFEGPAISSDEKGVFEDSQVLKADTILPVDVLTGPEHRVEGRVENDGFLNHYVLKSTYGDYEVLSDFVVRKRVHEVYAIKELKKIDTSSTVAGSVVDSGKKTVAGIGRLVTAPVDTVKGAGKGVVSLFDRAEESFTSKPSQSEDSRAQQFIGFSKSKRDIAAKVGVDVYSANEVLQSELERLAWADFSGGIGVSAALSVVPGGAGLFLSVSGGTRLLNEAINMTPPTELRHQNRQKLKAMGMDPDTIELFLNNTVFSPRDQTWLVAAIERMDGTANRELFLKVALQAGDRTTALKITQMAGMCAAYHDQETPIDRFYPIARVLYAKDKKGNVLVILPTDHILWSRRLDGVLAEIREKTEGKTFGLWTAGDVSKTCRDRLAKADWSVHTRVFSSLMAK